MRRLRRRRMHCRRCGSTAILRSVRLWALFSQRIDKNGSVRAHTPQRCCINRLQGKRDLPGDGVCNWRGKCVADLTVARSLFAHKMPVFRKALQASDHRSSEARHADEIGGRGGIGDAVAIHAERRPGTFCPCWPKIRAAMLLRTTDNRWCNGLDSGTPCFCAMPAVCRKERVEDLADCACWMLHMCSHISISLPHHTTRAAGAAGASCP